jgi:hypothetical protein
MPLVLVALVDHALLEVPVKQKHVPLNLYKDYSSK